MYSSHYRKDMHLKMYIHSVILILSCYISVSVQQMSKAKIELVNNVYNNIVVGISNTVDVSYELIDKIKGFLNKTNNVLTTSLK